MHTANIITDWFRTNNIETLPWPSYSPDINPIENVWGVIVKKLYQRNFLPQNADDLWAGIERVWEELSEEEGFLRPFLESMTRRLQAVIDFNGEMTKY